MPLPLETELRAERAAIVETMESLSDADFEHTETLCAGWAPRDVLAHLLGIDADLSTYVRARGNLDRAHADIIARYRTLDRPDLARRGRRWAAEPALTSRLAAATLLGDHAVHHEDVLRPLGLSRAVPPSSAAAIYRSGLILGARKLLSYRVEPTDGGPSVGTGVRVRGTKVALGLWLAGRRGLLEELVFEVR